MEGGDDRSMPWSEVEAVDPPGIESLTIRLFPPLYTGWPPEKSESVILRFSWHSIRIRCQSHKTSSNRLVCLQDGRDFSGRLRATEFISSLTIPP